MLGIADILPKLAKIFHCDWLGKLKLSAADGLYKKKSALALSVYDGNLHSISDVNSLLTCIGPGTGGGRRGSGGSRPYNFETGATSPNFDGKIHFNNL